MRLIDADVMIKNLTDMKKEYDAISLDGMIRGLQQQPTAYDIDKVLEWLDGLRPYHIYSIAFIQDAIEIVKAVGTARKQPVKLHRRSGSDVKGKKS